MSRTADVVPLERASVSRRRTSPRDELLAAIGFLTRLPAPISASSRPTTGAAAFGLVGALVGTVAAVPILLAGAHHPVLAGVASVAILAVMSGGLHLDGVADTIDALAAPPGRGEQARTDPRAGAAGVVAIVLVLAAEIAAVAELVSADVRVAAAVVVAGAIVARATAPVWATAAPRSVRPQAGLGAWFADETSSVAALFGAAVAAGLVAALAFLVGPSIAIAVAVGMLVSTVVVGLAIRARGRLDGDGFGFLIESTFVAILVAAAVLR